MEALTVIMTVGTVAGVIVAILQYRLLRRSKQELKQSRPTNSITAVPNELDYLDSVLKKVPLQAIDGIDVLAHTGSILIQNLLGHLREFPRRERGPVVLRVLLRDPLTECPRRRARILATCKALLDLNSYQENVTCQVRFYSAFQMFRGIFIRSQGNTYKDYFISAYHWRTREAGERSPGSFVTGSLKAGAQWSGPEEKTPKLVELADNWFQYLWGPGTIHTVLFDFDDTIVNTFDDHIDAWVHVVLSTLNGPPEAASKIRESIAELAGLPDRLRAMLTKLFLECYDANDIAEAITDDDALARELNKRRAAYRKSALLLADGDERAVEIKKRAFPGVVRAIHALRGEGYAVGIASLTEETTIREVLGTLDLLACSSFVLGRSDYSIRSLQKLKAKTFLAHKAVTLGGVPSHRILFVGDHMNDRDAAIDSGAAFLEARLVNGRTHIAGNDTDQYRFFTEYANLLDVVRKAEEDQSRLAEDRIRRLIREGDSEVSIASAAP